MHPHDEPSISDLRLQHVEEKLDLILGKPNEPKTPLPVFVTEVQLKETLEDILVRFNEGEDARLETIKNFGADLTDSFTQISNQISTMQKDADEGINIRAYQMVSLALGKIANAPQTLEKLDA
ncbi:hypothetical protein L2E82_10890 [Cichorium intybus]|uniref:Uncharacterized protein n=1 Tax=Cichorium intybus TaxID=13427 RepID=A0ACB9GDT1_CICIN|nr:hypothetical protein L2E82_10890 [Cichorium intybus]